MGQMLFPDEFEKYGRLMNKNFQSRPMYSFESKLRKGSNAWNQVNDFITDIGEWIEENREAFANNISVVFYFLVWIGLAIGVIGQLFSSFWSALLTAIIGGIIVYYAAAIGMFILMWTLQIFFYITRYIFYNIYTLLLTILLIASFCFSDQIYKPKDNNTIVSTPTILQPNYYCDVKTTLKVREYPRINSKEIGQLKRHEEVHVYSIDNNFAKIDFKGRIAYASADYLKIKTTSTQTQYDLTKNVKINELIGTKFTGYKDQRTLQDKLGFWCGNQLGYADGRFFIERWENEKMQKLWLVLVEKLSSNESLIRDILPFDRKSIGDIGTFPVYNKNTKQWSDYMMVQISNNNKLIKIFDVDVQNKKIIAQIPESYWGEIQTEWDSY